MAIQGLNGFQLGDRTLMVQRASQGRSSQTSYGGAGGGSGGGMGGGGAGMGANAAPLGTPVNLRDLGECFFDHGHSLRRVMFCIGNSEEADR